MLPVRGSKPPPISDGWALNIDGRVSNSGLFCLAHLQQIDTCDSTAYLICANRPNIPAQLHRWQGISGGRIAEIIRPLADADYVRIQALDGYQTVITRSMFERGLIAWRCDNRMLSPSQGAPARLIIPQRAGHKQVKWLSRLSFINHSELTIDPDSVEGWTPLSAWIDPVEMEAVIAGQRALLTGCVVSVSGIDNPVQAELRINGGFGHVLSLRSQQEDIFHWQADWTPAYAGEHRLELHVRAGGVSVTYRTAVHAESR